MDFDDIGNRLANLTMYDVKQFYTAAKNYALNISDIEAKVNEATSDDPWGASSTLMQEIAQATHNFQDFNEIMPAIYRNFMEREASEWRQIYKALQLLEYLVKHGSERVVDDARSHLSTIKILRNFHYIDEAAKDQGINVRNRAKEIAELLGDVDRIRAERRKARANKQKYQGAGNGDFVPGSGTGRYGGFGSDSFYAGGLDNAGARASTSSNRDAARDSFEAYDAGDDEDTRASSRPTTSRRAGASSTARAAAQPKKEEKVADLFSFDDDEPTPAPSQIAPASTAAAGNDSFDDFDDFQAAPSQAAAKAPPKPAAATPKAAAPANVFDFFGDEAPAAAQAAPKATASALSPGSKPMQPQRTASSTSAATQSAVTSTGASNGKTAISSAFNFDDLWTSSSGGAGGSGAAGKQKLSMAEMAKQKSSSAVWGSGGGAQQSKASGAKDPFDFL